jgi:hypothetical protein
VELREQSYGIGDGDEIRHGAAQASSFETVFPPEVEW